MIDRGGRAMLCIDNAGYEASLEPRRAYIVIDDQRARRCGLLRVIDESGEDYLYEASRFVDGRTDA